MDLKDLEHLLRKGSDNWNEHEKSFIRDIRMTEFFQEDYLKELYERLTESQQKKFNMIFKSLQDTLADGKIGSAIAICERTLKKDGKL